MNWFKNILIYRFTPDADFSEQHLENALLTKPFVPCGRQELKRQGWVSPSSFSESPVFVSNGMYLISLLQEERILPASVIKDELQVKVSKIEQDEARKVYRKEKDQLKDEIILELLPRAFSKRSATRALIMPQLGWIFVDAGSFKRAEDLLNSLREVLGTLKVKPLTVNQAPASVLSLWVQDEDQISTGFAVEDECELRDTSAEGGVIRVKGQNLFSDEIRAHLATDMQVTRLALTWQDQLSFMIYSDLSLHRLKLTDQYQEQLQQDSPEDEKAFFDAQLNQMGLELSNLMPSLIASFGGEPESP
jgi:recombination associated protein RdgC